MPGPTPPSSVCHPNKRQLIPRIRAAANIRTELDTDRSGKLDRSFFDANVTWATTIRKGKCAEVELPVTVHGTDFTVKISTEAFDAHFSFGGEMVGI